MAVIYPQGSSGGGLLSGLGTLATLGGSLFGAPWLGALGTGMTAADSILNGGGAGGLGNTGMTMKDILDQIAGAWKNPASGNIAQTPGKSNAQRNDEWQKALILQNQNPHERSGNAWQLF